MGHRRGAERTGAWRRGRASTLLLFLGGALLLGSGCVMHDAACYQRCMTRHRHCTTASQTTDALERCDANLAVCRQGCQW